MNVQNLLSEKTININLNANDKHEAISKMVDLIAKSNNITDVEGFKEEVLKRENISSTGIGEGIAIPHAKSEYVISPTIAIGIFPKKIDYSSVDSEKVDLIFLLAAPRNNDDHLEVLSKLSSFLLDEKFVYDVRHVNNPIETINVGNLATNPVLKYPANTGIIILPPINANISAIIPKNVSGL